MIKVLDSRPSIRLNTALVGGRPELFNILRIGDSNDQSVGADGAAASIRVFVCVLFGGKG